MPNYTQVRSTIDSMNRAAALLPQLQTIYEQAQFAEAAIETYQAGTDPTFNNAVNSIFTSAERQQLANMLTQLTQLVDAWAANHATLLNTEI